MSDPGMLWNTAGKISTGIGLLAFLAAVAFVAYRATLQRQAQHISALPPKDRLKAVELFLNNQGIDTSSLSAPQKLKLADRQTAFQLKKLLVSASVIILLAVICAVAGVVAIIFGPVTPIQRDPVKEAECVEMRRYEGPAHQDGKAQMALGDFYQDGRCVPQDVLKAVSLYEQAARNGDTWALILLGEIYGRGIGTVRQDFTRAKQYFEEAEAHGEARGSTLLGTLYENGKGVAKDPAKAANYYQQAADAGDARGLTLLGALYEAGTGVPKDPKQAQALYARADEKGDERAPTLLGALAEAAGEFQKAKRLYERGAARGDDRAKHLLIGLADRM